MARGLSLFFQSITNHYRLLASPPSPLFTVVGEHISTSFHFTTALKKSRLRAFHFLASTLSAPAAFYRLRPAAPREDISTLALSLSPPCCIRVDRLFRHPAVLFTGDSRNCGSHISRPRDCVVQFCYREPTSYLPWLCWVLVLLILRG